MSSRLRVGAFSDIFAAIQEEIQNMYSKTAATTAVFLFYQYIYFNGQFRKTCEVPGETFGSTRREQFNRQQLQDFWP